MDLMNVGEFFKYLNSDTCEEFYQGLTYDNKKEIIDKMMKDESFTTNAHLFVSNDNVIRSKIDSKLGQILKKNSVVTKEEPTKCEVKSDNIVLIPQENDDWTDVTKVDDYLFHHPEAINDIEKGKYIGSGIFLKREGHLIKMTTPAFTVYY